MTAAAEKALLRRLGQRGPERLELIRGESQAPGIKELQFRKNAILKHCIAPISLDTRLRDT
jgi:hypothetical protein